MLPPSYALPFAILLVLGGALSCFAGYRLLKIVLALYGFLLGAMMASSIMGVSNGVGMVVAAAIGGLVGALVFVFAYFIGIALVGAGLGALTVNLIWSGVRTGDVPWQVAVVAAVVGAITAMVLQRYVIIVTTAFSGAWTLIIGAITVAGDRTVAHAASATDAWVFYPISPAPGGRWASIAWVVVGLIGTGVQLAITSKRK
jgi:hypothetical protein